MAPRLVLLFVAGIAAAGIISSRSVEAVAAAQIVESDSPRYDAQGRLIAPERYREWVFLSAGLDMNYDAAAAKPARHIFGNVFAPRAAYAAFQRTGRWPDKTVLILENRLGSTKGSINKSGQFQTGVVRRSTPTAS